MAFDVMPIGVLPFGPVQPGPVRVDGRALRAERTREKLLAATRALMARGDLRPKCIAIAARARVSSRSLFTHFENVGDLYAAAMSPEMRAEMAGKLRALDDDALVRAVQYAPPDDLLAETSRG